MKRSACSSPEDPLAQTSRGSKYYKQAYRKEWESMPDFKGWLTEVVGHPQRAYCTVCAKTLHAHRLSLLKHTVTLKHTTAALRNYTQDSSVHHYEVDAPPTLSNSEPDSLPVLVVPSLVPLITINEPKPSLPMKVRTKQPNAASLKNLKNDEEVEVPNNKSSERLAEGASICEESNVDKSVKTAEEDKPEEDSDEKPGAGTSSSLNNAKEQQNVSLPADQPTPIPPSPPMVAKESLVPKAVKPVTEHPISTHVLDTAKGSPVGNLHVSLYRLVDGRWTSVGEGVTTPDGRCNSFLKRKDFLSGRYKIHFDVDRYFEIRKQDSLYPFIEIVFDARSSMDHYHIPLLLSPFGYTTYRGS